MEPSASSTALPFAGGAASALRVCQRLNSSSLTAPLTGFIALGAAGDGAVAVAVGDGTTGAG